MIPKIIHYCWFGKSPLPKLAQKCINSWKKYFPDYEIKCWDESNFDINMMAYTQEAYQAKKFAFVSDVARFWILYNFGGIYFDTDVEVIKPFTHIIDKGAFMGCETMCDKEHKLMVAPGLGLGAEPGHPVYKTMLEHYEKLHYFIGDVKNNETVVDHMTSILQLLGLKEVNIPQDIEGITIYPKEYFCPMSTEGRVMTITNNTLSIHHYAKSWVGKKGKLKRKISVFLGPQLTVFIIKAKRFLLRK